MNSRSLAWEKRQLPFTFLLRLSSLFVTLWSKWRFIERRDKPCKIWRHSACHKQKGIDFTLKIFVCTKGSETTEIGKFSSELLCVLRKTAVALQRNRADSIL